MKGSRFSMALAILACVAMLTTVIPHGVAAALPSEKTFITEGAEESTFADWNKNWDKFDADYTQPEDNDSWCRTMHEVHSGSHSIYCAKNGWNSHYTLNGAQCEDVNITRSSDPTQKDHVLRYDTRMDSIMWQGLDASARYYGTITVTFWFYSDTGASDAKQPLTGATVGYDFLNLVYWTGSGSSLAKHVAWTDTSEEAGATKWIQKSVEIPNNATRVGFEFVSGTVAPAGGDATDKFSSYGIKIVNGGMREGVFLDDISVVGSNLLPAQSLMTAVEPLPEYQNGLTFNVNWTNNDPQVGMKWIDLYYRIDGTGNWIKYETSLRPDGKFPNNTYTIQFTAPREGTYEFFTRGTDNLDVMEPARNAADASTTIDLSPPSSNITFNGNGDGTNFRGVFSFSLTATDSVSGIKAIHYRLNGGDWREYTMGVSLVKDGDYTIQYYATDLAGNDESVKTSTIHLQDAKPGISFEKTVVGKDGSATISFSVGLDGTSVTTLQYSLDGKDLVDLNPANRSVSFTGLSNGEHTVTIKATDSNGEVLTNTTSFKVGSDGVGSILSNPLVLVGIIAAIAVVIVGAVWFVRRKK